MTLKTWTILLAFLLAFGCTHTPVKESSNDDQITVSQSNKVILSSEIKWEALNPARGDKSPKAGTIWGNRKGKEPTGFLAKFVDGFSSPPHIHNVTYRAMVVEGLVHNDDADAEKMWMPKGSFWTQPAGAAHITASKGESIAYVEIDHGPYLVKPIEEHFDNGELPVNISKDNLIWLNSDQAKMIKNDNAEIAFLWEHEELKGRLIKVKKGFDGEILNTGNIFHAVVIEGEVDYKANEILHLDAGSYFTASEKSRHKIHSNNDSECTIYIRTNGKITVQ